MISTVITSIQHPTEAVIAFAKSADNNVIVVGDRKSPENWSCRNVEYISVEKQEALKYALVKCLPYNTQNTATRKELFPLLYLPAYVTFRFTDILRGLIAQPIMWLYDYHLGYSGATVTQKRNAHDYFEDFQSMLRALSRWQSTGGAPLSRCRRPKPG